MKAKYYPDCLVLEASLGKKKPSFAWQSIQNSLDLVREGLLWRIGNGQSVRIWGDRWLPTPTTFKVQSPPQILDPAATVSTLIDGELKWWNKALVEQIFSAEESAIIQSIPISQTNKEDRLYWRGTTRGTFSVRSAYYIQKSLEEAQVAEGSSRVSNSLIWRSLWRLNVPNVEKNFLWRACHDSLPTRENLCRKRIIDDPVCSFCMTEVESTFHILWQCPSARDVWSAGSVKFQKSVFSGPDFLQVAEGMLGKCDTMEFQLFVGISRRLWLRRNEAVHGGSFQYPDGLVKRALLAVEEFRMAQGAQSGELTSGGNGAYHKWMAPSTGLVKVN